MTPPSVSVDHEHYYPPPYAPSANSPALQRVIRFLAVVQDPLLLSTSLEFFATYLSSMAATQAFLLHSELRSTMQLLVGVLRFLQPLETHTVIIGPPSRSAEAEDAWPPYQLSEDELERIAPMPEPERSFQWYA
jgi:chromatin structure-remodeling complex subunit RSC9